MMRRKRDRRPGLTLLEVVLSLAILAGAFAMLAQLVGLGTRAAGNARDLTQAQVIAESMMSEIAAGIVNPSTLSLQPVPSNPQWYASAYVQSTSISGLLQVIVRVERTRDKGRPAQFELVRWIRDPNLAMPTDEESSSSSSGSSSSGSTSGANAASNNSTSGATSSASSGGASSSPSAGGAPSGSTGGGSAPTSGSNSGTNRGGSR